MKIIEKTAYECPLCQVLYVSKDDAIDCLNNHSQLKNLQIVDAKNYSDNRFPGIIAIEDSAYSGAMTEYQLHWIGSFEDFYKRSVEL